MSNKLERGKTQLEALEAHLLEKLSAKLKPSTFFRKDYLSQLPEEIAYHIIGYLNPCDLMACAGVSRTWRRLCEDDRTWRQKCLDKGYVELAAPSFRVLGGWAANRANEEEIFPHMDLQEAEHNRREGEIAYGRCYERSAWKSLYLRKKRIISNWRSRAIQSRAVLECDTHVSCLHSCLQIRSGRIYAGFHHGSLRVWNVDDAQPVFTLNTDAISTLQVSDDGKYIVSGSWDETVRVWCGQTGAQLHVLRGHTDSVQCMSLHGTTLVSGSADQTLRVWDVDDGRCLHILAGHFSEVYCVQFDGERVVSGSGDSTIKVWNVHTGECLHTLTGHTEAIDLLLFEPERDLVISVSFDGTSRFWDVRRGTCIASLVDQRGQVAEMQLRGDFLIFCYYSSNVWDIRDGGSCIRRLQGPNGHTRFITSLQWLDSGLLVTASGDGLDLWDVDKGIFVRGIVALQPPGSVHISAHKATETLLVCAVGSRDGTPGKLLLIDFDASYP